MAHCPLLPDAAGTRQPACLKGQASSSSSSSRGSMASFKQRLTPLMVRPRSSCEPPLGPLLLDADPTMQAAAVEAACEPPPGMSAAVSPRACCSPQRKLGWSPLTSVASSLHGPQLDSPATGPQPSNGSISTSMSAAEAGTPGSLGRTLRLSALGEGCGNLGGKQLSRSLASYQEQQLLVAAAEAGKTAAAAVASCGNASRLTNGSSKVGTPTASCSSSPQRHALPRPPSSMAHGATTCSGDFRISAYRGSPSEGSGGSRSVGSTPRGAWPRITGSLGGEQSESGCLLPAIATTLWHGCDVDLNYLGFI